MGAITSTSTLFRSSMHQIDPTNAPVYWALAIPMY